MKGGVGETRNPAGFQLMCFLDVCLEDKFYTDDGEFSKLLKKSQALKLIEGLLFFVKGMHSRLIYVHMIHGSVCLHN